MIDWKEKNKRRKDARDSGSWTRGQVRYARALRRECDGKFGNMRPDFFNERVPGTTGAERATKGDSNG